MILVRVDPTAIPRDWLDKAARLTTELAALDSPEERRAYIERHQPVWKELKAILLGFSRGKCWYSEAREICSDYHVDHFRPKGRAGNLDGSAREGYWWLAFDWNNYRIAAGVCNSPHKDDEDKVCGKHDYFPLKSGSPFAKAPNDDLRDEVIYLLDPCDPADPPLLTFDESGMPVPRAPMGTWAALRARESARLYHLHYTPLVEERKKVWALVRRCVAVLETLLQKTEEEVGPTLEQDRKRAVEDLLRLIAPEAELAGTARAALMKCSPELGAALFASLGG